ncbi:Ribosomal RNA large subunit methyltransferase E [Bienertia sinuspersici]
MSLALEICKTILTSFAALFLKTAQLKSLSTRVENSKLASFLCCFHLSPSIANIPSPNRSLSISLLYFPFAYLSKLVFRICSMFLTSVV